MGGVALNLSSKRHFCTIHWVSSIFNVGAAEQRVRMQARVNQTMLIQAAGEGTPKIYMILLPCLIKTLVFTVEFISRFRSKKSAKTNS